MLETSGYSTSLMRLEERVHKKKAIVKSSNYADILNVRIAVGLTVTFRVMKTPFFLNQIGSVILAIILNCRHQSLSQSVCMPC